MGVLATGSAHANSLKRPSLFVWTSTNILSNATPRTAVVFLVTCSYIVPYLHVVEDLKKVFNTHAIATEKQNNKFNLSLQLSTSTSPEPTAKNLK